VICSTMKFTTMEATRMQEPMTNSLNGQEPALLYTESNITKQQVHENCSQ